MSDFSLAMSVSQSLDTMERALGAMEPGRPLQDRLASLLGALAADRLFSRPCLEVHSPAGGLIRLPRPRAGRGLHAAGHAPAGEVMGRVLAEGRPLVIPAMKGRPEFRRRLLGRPARQAARLAFLCVPVRMGGSHGPKVVGALGADTPTACEEELRLRSRLLEAVAGLAGRLLALQQEQLSRGLSLARTQEGAAGGPDGGIVACSKDMRRVMEQVARLAPGEAAVLLCGEAGVGKELLARRIHALSARSRGPFVVFPCQGVPRDLLEGELFGWERGALPGAGPSRAGRLREADGGTLFLDEVAGLPLAAQARLVHALRGGGVRPLGSERSCGVDVRLVCASSRSLGPLVRQGQFRDDLLALVGAFPLLVPPLRERKDDILPLAERFLQEAARAGKKPVRRISARAAELLRLYPWPGNVRELRATMERAVRACEGDTLREGHLPLSLQTSGSLGGSGGATARANLPAAVARMEREYIVDALARAMGNIHQAARDLDTTYRIIYYKMKKYGIDYRQFLPGAAGGGRGRDGSPGA